jgi:hypothetical protein
LLLWKVEAQQFIEDCFKRHQDLIDYVDRELGQ